MEVSDQLQIKERAPGSHWIGGWVEPRAGLDTVVKRGTLSPSWDSNPDHPIIQPVVSRLLTKLSRLLNRNGSDIIFSSLWAPFSRSKKIVNCYHFSTAPFVTLSNILSPLLMRYKYIFVYKWTLRSKLDLTIFTANKRTLLEIPIMIIWLIYWFL
jgi:hypothetical protein